MFTLSEVAKSYGSKTLFEDVTLTINRTDRLGLVGPNGAGKSTLFKLILDQEEPDSGLITRQRGATVGFLPQESAPAGEETVLGLLTVTVTQKKARLGRNPRTGEPVQVPARTGVKVKVLKTLKDAANRVAK